MNTALEFSTRVVQEGGRRCKKTTLNDLVHLTPLRIPLMNPPIMQTNASWPGGVGWYRQPSQHGVLHNLAWGDWPGRCDLYCDGWSVPPVLKDCPAFPGRDCSAASCGNSSWCCYWKFSIDSHKWNQTFQAGYYSSWPVCLPPEYYSISCRRQLGSQY